MSATSSRCTSPTSSKTATATSGSSVWTWIFSVASSPTTRTESPISSSRGTKDRVSRPVPVTMKFVQYRNRLSKWCGRVVRAGSWCGSSGSASKSSRNPATIPARITTRPCAPASTTPASASTSSCSGVRSTARSPALVATSSTSASSWSCSLVPDGAGEALAVHVGEVRGDRVGHLADHGEHRPLGGVAHGLVGGIGGARERRGDEHRVDELPRAAGRAPRPPRGRSG